MLSKRWFARLGVLTIILLAAVAALGFYMKTAGTEASENSPPPIAPKIELVSQVVHAERLNPANTNRPIYRVTAEYSFRNPGDECSVRFAIPDGYINNTVPGERCEILEDGKPVSIPATPHPDSATVGVTGRDSGWRTQFTQGQVKKIALKYYIEPAEKNGLDTFEMKGKKRTITKAVQIFPPVVEELVLPVGLGTESIDVTGNLQVEIDCGRSLPHELVAGEPGGFKHEGRKIVWQGDLSGRRDVFKVGVMHIADGLYSLDDAKQVVRTLTDTSYSGYMRNLSLSERKGFLRIARNGVFARYGFRFKGELYDYFKNLAWYKPNPNYNDSLLTTEDLEIVKLILDAEARI